MKTPKAERSDRRPAGFPLGHAIPSLLAALCIATAGFLSLPMSSAAGVSSQTAGGSWTLIEMTEQKDVSPSECGTPEIVSADDSSTQTRTAGCGSDQQLQSIHSWTPFPDRLYPGGSLKVELSNSTSGPIDSGETIMTSIGIIRSDAPSGAATIDAFGPEGFAAANFDLPQGETGELLSFMITCSGVSGRTTIVYRYLYQSGE